MADESVPPESGPATPFLRWPPPGLERMQGDLWRVAARGALAGAILVLPLIFVLTGQEQFASLGPFADAWWVTLVLATVGLGYALDALANTARMLKRVAKALEAGYDWRAIGYVLADLRRDMGFLLQGKRHFSVLDARERSAIAGLRLLSVAAFALAGLWLPVALGLMLLLASRGLATPGAVWAVTLAPPGVGYLLGGALGTAEDGRVRRARRTWYRQPWAADLVADEIGVWKQELSAQDGSEASGAPRSVGAPWLRRLAVLTGASSVVIAVPVLTLVPTSAIGPMLAQIAVPSFEQWRERAAEAEAFRGYALAPDPSVGPQEAGRLLQSLLYVGASDGPGVGEVEPAQRIESPWLPRLQSRSPLEAEPHRWPDEIFGRVAAGLTPEARAYLAEIAAHPGHPLLTRLSRAELVDVAGARWANPFPAGVTAASVPIPNVGSLRSGAYAHIAVAAHELAAGRPAAAEERIREVISLGLLLGDQGPTVFENLVGNVLTDAGGRALQQFYEVTGRGLEAVHLRSLRTTAERAARRLHSAPPPGVEGLVRSLPAMVLDSVAARGLRWEFFVLTATLTPCLNLHRMVFGPDEAYLRFVNDARAALVRWPSEEEYFRLAQAGYWGATGDARESWVGRLLGVSMRSGQGSCGHVVRRFSAIEGVM